MNPIGITAVLYCVAECHTKTNLKKKVKIFKTVLGCGKSCTARVRVNISTSTAEIVLVGISAVLYHKHHRNTAIMNSVGITVMYSITEIQPQ